MTQLCSLCELPIDVTQGHVPVQTQMQSGRVTGTFHKACYKRRRRGLSGSTRSEPRSGSTYFSDLHK